MPTPEELKQALKVIKGLTLPGEWTIISPSGKATSGRNLKELAERALKLQKQQSQEKAKP